MDDNTVFVRTAKGRSAAAGILPAQLAPQLRILLALIDGKSALGELRRKASDQIPVDKLRVAIDELLTHGYVEISRSTAPEDNDLNFTHLSSAEPGPQPTRAQMADALNITLPGMRELRSTGCFVNIANRPTQRIPPRSGDKYGVLIIDSEQAAVLLFARTLMLAGFNVRAAANREEIIAELNKPPLPDVLLLDTALPGLNGLDVLARIHQHPRLAAVPIIVISSKLEQEEVAAVLARGASAYMVKPCMPDALRASIHAVLGLT
jgi:twitching motility two-component system response regulator PilH